MPAVALTACACMYSNQHSAFWKAQHSTAENILNYSRVLQSNSIKGAFFAQRDDLGAFHYIIDCLTLMDI